MLPSVTSSSAATPLTGASASVARAREVAGDAAVRKDAQRPTNLLDSSSLSALANTKQPATKPAFQDLLAKDDAAAQASYATRDEKPDEQLNRAAEQEMDAEVWLLNALEQQLMELQVSDAPTEIQLTQGMPILAVTEGQPVNESGLLGSASGAHATHNLPNQVMGSMSAVTQQTQNAIPGEPLLTEKMLADKMLTDKILSANERAATATDKSVAVTNPALALFLNRAAAVVEQAQVSQVHKGSASVNESAFMSAQIDSEALLAEAGTVTALTAERALNSVQSPVASAAVLGMGDKTIQENGFLATLKLPSAEAKWGEQLLHTLRDQVQVQLQQRIQNATIRLDPPEMGSLEIFLSHESGRLNVHINASQADVARLLQHTSDRLRHELAGGQFTQVNVHTSNDAQSGQQHSRQSAQQFGNEDAILANGHHHNDHHNGQHNDNRRNSQPTTDKTRVQTGQASDVLIRV